MELLARLPASQGEARQEAEEQARTLVKEALGDLRRAVKALGPVALETFSLPEAVGALVEGFRQTHQIPVTFQREGEPVPLSPRLAVPLYRAAQEALTNVSRHAAATQAGVTLRFEPGSVTLTVEDNGRGGAAPFGFGLRGLQERAAALGGEFRAGPGEERGFRVEMKIPL